MLEHDLVKDSEIELSSTSLVQVWGDDITHGFIISSDGSIAQFTPTMVEEDELIMKAVMLILLISVPGCVIGLIFMNSKTLQGLYYSRRKARRVKAQEKATELEKQKAASKKNEDSD
jgi:flagellar biosynthesis component FlhA